MIQTRIITVYLNSPIQYVTSTEFNKIFDNEKYTVPFSVLYINCRSLSKNFTNLLAYIHTVDHAFCVIAVSEIWLKPEHTCLYNHHHRLLRQKAAKYHIRTQNTHTKYDTKLHIGTHIHTVKH